jgi:hypothetical protein
VADEYKKAGEGGASIVRNWLAQAADEGLSGDAAKQWAKQQIQARANSTSIPALKAQFSDAAARFEQHMDGGNLYKVDLPDSTVAKMLDYDNPVPDAVRQKVSAAAMQKFGSGSTGTSGNHLLDELANEFKRAGSKSPNADAAEFLRQQGIPGVRYLDGGSRAKGGTSNFVVFPGEENILSILERNGQPVR